MSDRGSTLLAFLMGAVAGSVTALLIAPDKGEVTRQRLREGANRAYRRGEELAGETRDVVTEQARRASGTAREKVDDVTGTARHQVDAIKGAVSEGREAYQRELKRGESK
ncbi:MAG: hypothetical protein GF355_00680 [Candidatus Eisenbacteria bacterium]|nr:hypothetical protein [Candidatus Eisenbacteria bacterium]